MAIRTAIPRTTLAADARNRALRTLLQVAAPALVVALQAVIAWAGGATFDWRITLGAAIVAIVAPVLAFVQRVALDPTGWPSATPPTDPIVAAKVRADRQRLGHGGQGGHARIGGLAAALLVLVVVLLLTKATFWLTGSLGIVVVILIVLAVLL